MEIVRDVVTVAAILIGPVVAVINTLWWQRRKEKRDAKVGLFLTLMAHRRASPPTEEWVSALNRIDVLFSDHLRVVELWNRY